MKSQDSDNVNGLKFENVLVPDLVRQSKGRYFQKVQKGFYCAKCLLKARELIHLDEKDTKHCFTKRTKNCHVKYPAAIISTVYVL